MVMIRSRKLFDVVFKKKKEEKKPSIIKELMNMPENVKLEAYIENDEIIVKIKRKERES